MSCAVIVVYVGMVTPLDDFIDIAFIVSPTAANDRGKEVSCLPVIGNNPCAKSMLRMIFPTTSSKNLVATNACNKPHKLHWAIAAASITV